MKKSLLSYAAMALFMVLWAVNGTAQEYPQKPIRMILPFASGGSLDLVARALAQKYTEAWGQPVLVEGRPSSGGIVAADAVAKSTPDGHTLLLATCSLAITPSLFKKLPLDPVKDLAPVSLLTSQFLILAVDPGLSAASVKDLIAVAKAQRGKLNFGSTGLGTLVHLSAEMFRQAADIDITHVPYKGDAPMMTALLSKEVHFAFGTTNAMIPHGKTGKLRLLAVTGSKRSERVPDIPTMIEAGVRDFDLSCWNGIFAPAGTPQSIVDRISADTARILRLPDIRQRLSDLILDPVGSSAREFAAVYKTDVEKFQNVIRVARIPQVD